MTKRKATDKQLDCVFDEITYDHVLAFDRHGWMIVQNPEFNDDGRKWPWCHNGSLQCAGPIPSWCEDIRESPKVESTVVNFPPKGDLN